MQGATTASPSPGVELPAGISDNTLWMVAVSLSAGRTERLDGCSFATTVVMPVAQSERDQSEIHMVAKGF